MATKVIEIPDIGPVTLYKRRGNRSLRLSVAADGEIRVSLPSWVPYLAGEQFVRSKIDWIRAHQIKPSSDLQQGQAIGKAHHLHFEPVARATKITTRLQQNQIQIFHPATLDTAHPHVQKAAQAACIRALRKEAEQLLPQRLKELAERTGYTYRNVDIKQMKSRWGSCSANKDITLNLFLMQLPWRLIDYVLMHELTHTKVMRHGAPFWQELEKHVPHAKSLRKEIAKHHPVLAGN
ncbi:M48 family metallopeptidase [Candidatus Saccharibacteria bacterium]|jgi:Predicted metal-dependent hydrolase|nr:M48 family metallopeptidase [Candidatus Saccharibacteria bacterium]